MIGCLYLDVCKTMGILNKMNKQLNNLPCQVNMEGKKYSGRIDDLACRQGGVPEESRNAVIVCHFT